MKLKRSTSLKLNQLFVIFFAHQPPAEIVENYLSKILLYNLNLFCVSNWRLNVIQG